MTSECPKCRGDERQRPCEYCGAGRRLPFGAKDCCSYAAQGSSHRVLLHSSGCPSLDLPKHLKPQHGHRCAGVRIREGRMVEAVLGVVTDASYLPGLRVHVTATRAFDSDTPLDLMPADEWWDSDERRWIGEWGGHAKEGTLCWCVPTVEHVGACDLVIHREREEAS